MEWRSAYGGKYEIAEDGTVRNAQTGRVRKVHGHSLRDAAGTINYPRLVCEAWHGAPPTSVHQAAHNDGNRDNNRPDNLRWATPKENENDKHEHGTYHLRYGGAKLDQQAAAEIRYKLSAAPFSRNGRRQRELVNALCAEYAVSKATLSYIRRGAIWRHPEWPSE